MISEHSKIYRVSFAYESDSPKIDLENPKNGTEIDWLTWGEALRDERPMSDFFEVDLKVDHSDALKWDCYFIGSSTNLYSDRAKRLLEPYCKKCIEFHPAKVNGTRYWCMKVIDRMPWFDFEKSTIKYSNDDPTYIEEVNKYVFKKELIDDPSLFCVIGRGTSKYCTESLKNLIEQAGLRGFSFTDVETLK